MPCCVYKDPVLHTAQALSLVGFLLGSGGWISFCLGFVAMIKLQVVWCCRMDLRWLSTAAWIAGVVAVFDLVAGVLTLTILKEDACWWTNDYDPYTEYYCNYQALAIIVFCASACWVVVCVLLFYFIRSGRLDKCREESDNGTLAGAVPATYLPDGTTIAACSKGSKTATETLKTPIDMPNEPE